MKKNYAILAVFLALAAGVALYSKLWFDKTDELKQNVVATISQMEKDEENPFVLKYDAIERAGYPFNVEIVLTNPQIVSVNYPFKASHVGKVSVGSSLSEMEKVWIKSVGTTEITSQLDNKKENFKLAGTTYFKCDYCGKGLENLRTREDVLKWLPFLLKDMKIEVSDFAIAEAERDNANTFADVLKIQQGSLIIKNDEKDGFHNFTLGFDAKGASTFATNQSLESYQKLFPNVDKLELKKVFFNLGTSNIVFQSHGSFPTFDHPFYQNPSIANIPSLFSFVIDKSIADSDLYSSNANALFELKKSPDQLNGIITFDQQVNATDKLHQKLVEILKVLAKNWENDPTLNKQTLARLITQNAPELVPNFTSFGTIEMKLNSKLEGRGVSTSNSGDIVFDLNDFKFISALYGLELNGHATRKDLETAANMNILIKHPRELLTDFFNYYNRWQKLLVESKVMTPKEVPFINERSINLIIQFLESLSQVKDSDKLEIILIKNQEGVRIGNRDFAEVMGSFAELSTNLEIELKKANPEQ